ncbi:MAG TPA: ABC transporter permease, partial [Reyranella sp.]|nr:ABC transporter permease [Reyranella sp.]
SVIGLYRNSANLLYHRQITLLDIVVARQILEFIATTTALFFMWLVLYLPGAVSMVDDPFYVLLGWVMMGLLGFGFGMIFAALTELSHTFERFILPIQYIAVPLSGCFFLVDWLPTWLQRIAVYNPLINPYEVLRHGYFGDVIVTHYKLDYFFAVTAVIIAIGFWSVRAVRHRVQVA